MTTNISPVVVWGILAVVVFFILSAVIVTFILVQLPATYFVMPEEKRSQSLKRWALVVVKNLLGMVLLITGVIMLFIPGQGILTILIGLMLLNFPGKRRLEYKLISQRNVLEKINALRHRFGKASLVIEKHDADNH